MNAQELKSVDGGSIGRLLRRVALTVGESLLKIMKEPFLPVGTARLIGITEVRDLSEYFKRLNFYLKAFS